MTTNADQPNIVFILVDDLGQRDIGCYGSTFYETPNIDRLAREGMRFTDAYAACPVCSPTRASIMCGKYPARVGVTNYIDWSGKAHPSRGKLIDAPYIDHLPETETSVAAALRDGGYQTWHVGKWHIGGEPYYPQNHGFDVNVGGSEYGLPRHGYFNPWRLPGIDDDDAPEGAYLDDYLTDKAVDLVKGRDPDRPFFLNMSFYLVHTPIQAKAPLVEKYEAKRQALRLDRGVELVEGEMHPGDHKRDVPVVRRVVQSHPTYAAMIEILDDNVGKLLDELDRQGIADNTIVVFTGDNGGLSTSEGSPTCNYPLREGKGWMEEGGTREAMLLRWPEKVEAGSTTDALMTSPDFYPTLLEAAGLDPRPQQHVDGVSFMPALRGEQHERGPVFWHYPHYGNQGSAPASSIREGDDKLIEWFEDGRLALYDLRHDLSETRNLVEDKPDRARELQEKLRAWRADIEAILPQPNPDYVPPADPAADPTV